MSSENGSNAVLTIAVVVLGYVMYTRLAQARTQVVSTGTTQTSGLSKGQQNTLIGASLLGSLVSSFSGTLGGTTKGGQNSFTIPEAFTSTAWNPDEISSDISSDTLSALQSQGMDSSNIWGFFE
jgi:hypothetical protein